MSKRLTVGNQVFEYPDNTQNPGWGEQAAEWASAVTDVINVFQGPNDLVYQTVSLGVSGSPAIINGMFFSVSSVAAFKLEYTLMSGTSPVEYGTLNGINTGANFDFEREQIGDASFTFSIVAGQVKYTCATGYNIRFTAKTIDKA